MHTSGEHPAAQYESEMRVAQQRAGVAVVLLGLTAASRVVNLPVLFWQNALIRQLQGGESPSQEALDLSNALVQGVSNSHVLLLLVTGVLFLRWLHKVAAVTGALGGETLWWTPREAVLGFIIPLLNFARPYQIMRDIHDHLAPDAVAEPPMQVRADETTGYRQVNLLAPPPSMKLPHAFLGAWWGCFWVGNLVANFASRLPNTALADLAWSNVLHGISDAIDLVSALLAILMVRAVTARLQERFRRIRHTPVEALQAAGITVA
jgi:hypothetical protein